MAAKQPLEGSRGKTFKMDPNAVHIADKGHFLHDPESPDHPDPELVKKIDALGFFGTIVVTKIDDEAFVMMGRERLLAVREVNRMREERGEKPLTIEVQYRRCPDPTTATRMMVAENCNRRKVTTVQEARYMTMLRDTGMDEEMLAAEFNCSVGTVRNRLRLGDQPDCVLTAVSKGKISAAKAAKLTGTNAERKEAIKAEVEKGGAGAGKGRRKKPSAKKQKQILADYGLDMDMWKDLCALMAGKPLPSHSKNGE